jgi:murein L,D-transpeptidase YafK
VEVNNLQLLRNDHLILARFNQRYKTEVFNSEGEKRLFLQKNSNQWKIMGEFFEGADKIQVATKRRAVSKTEEVKRFIDLWRKAWERKDLKTYITCYDTEFRSRGMGLKSWKRHRERLNRKHRSLKIHISNLKVEQVSDRAARVTFNQNYRADGYHDVGLKEISLIKKGKHWKIRKEEWQPLGRSSRL